MDLSLLSKLHIEPNKGPLVLALSGGVDSMALFHRLSQDGYALIIAHVNHGIRRESDMEYLAIQALASQHNMLFEGLHLSPFEANFHHEAHQARKVFLVQVAKKHHAQAVLTAHHSNDQIETVLHRISRGSNLHGYGGMHPAYKHEGVWFIKPLLTTSKHDIIDYALKHQITYYEDASNHTTDYTRNVIRHNVLKPLLRDLPDISRKINDYTDQLHSAYDFIRESALQFINDLTHFSLHDFHKLHPALKSEVIACLLEQHHVSCTTQKIKDILSFLSQSSGTKTLNIGSSLVCIRSYDSFSFSKGEIKEKYPEVFVHDFGSYAIGHLGTFHFVQNVANAHTFHIKLCYNERAFPFVIRTRKNGDYITMPYGTKKIKDLMIDAKIPKHLRDQIPLLAGEGNHVLWVPGLAVSSVLENGGENVMYVVYDQGEKNDD